jgi:hypothetical protein
MCIHCLGHFFPLSPSPTLFPLHPSVFILYFYLTIHTDSPFFYINFFSSYVFILFLLSPFYFCPKEMVEMMAFRNTDTILVYIYFHCHIFFIFIRIYSLYRGKFIMAIQYMLTLCIG